MTTVAFDNRFIQTGREEIRSIATNSLLIGSNSSAMMGYSGSMETFGHPYPYVTGGPWSLVRTKLNPTLLTGIWKPSSPGFYTKWDSFRVGGTTSNGVDATLIGSTTFNDVLANTNPSAPHVDLPSFFAELRELPELIWKQGKTLLKSTARANLTSEFGWELLVSDIKQMLDFQKAADRRAAHLSRGYRKGGFRFERELRQGSYISSEVITNNYGISGMSIATQNYAWAREWCSVSWKPDFDVRDGIPSPRDISFMAFRAVVGGTVDAATVWNTLPWTWLLDWFGDVGSYLSSKRNLVGFHPGECYVMQHRVRGSLSRVTKTPAGFTANVIPTEYKRESKTRTLPAGPSLVAGMPILTGRQIGILGSLAVLKHR